MNAPSKNFRDLIVWQKAHQFVLRTYEFSNKFPREEIYCLTSQFRRAAVSIAANIAEGYKKKGKNDKLRFYNIAEGSLSECQYYCILAQDLKYGNSDLLLKLSFEVEKLLTAYCDSIVKSR